MSNPAASAGLQASYEFHVGAEVFHILASDCEVLARSGRSSTPADVMVQCDLETFIALDLRQIAPAAALREGRVNLLQRQRNIFMQAFRVLEYCPKFREFPAQLHSNPAVFYHDGKIS
ncbi:hypothetical protein [Burkholderia sp. Ac-20353]|uniref:hypothetical protein n=1 Tax=Burkholderia sp. Ac-20353 TaxID=2703894 RepID=UPI00197BEB2D|nr:hypothetical protein [Burkholderia sp. Ac-20353]